MKARLFLAVLLASAVLARAGVSYDESAVFSFDTRDYLAGLAAESATFSFDTRLADGQSGSAVSALFAFNTRNVTLVSVTVTGPTNMDNAASADYTATATYSDNSTQDVSLVASWRITGGVANPEPLARVALRGRTFIGSLLGSPQPWLIRAKFLGRDSADFAVTVGSSTSLGVWLHAPQTTFVQQSGAVSIWRLQAGVARIFADTGTLTRAWSLDGQAIAETSPGVIDMTFTGTPGVRLLTLNATDSTGKSGTASINAVFNRPALNEPGEKSSPSMVPPGEGSFVGTNGAAFDFGSNFTNNGFILVVHGMDDSPATGWMTTLGQEIVNRFNADTKPRPNIALYDWSAHANPSRQRGHDGYYEALFRRLFRDDEYVQDAGGATIAEDVLTVQSAAVAQGQHLARQLKHEMDAGHINAAKPIHLIGHSAGGFVVGQAALELRRLTPPIIVDLVTMLDTPFPIRGHFPSPTAPGAVERYISSIYGNNAPDLEMRRSDQAAGLAGILQPSAPPVQTSANYHKRYVEDWQRGSVGAHSNAHEWYIETVRHPDQEQYQDGFYYTPFYERHWPATGTTGAQSLAAAAKALPTGAQFLGGFSTFGNVVVSGGSYTLTEDTNAGICQDIALPIGTQSIKFRYQFTNAGDGDFLAVSFGDFPPVYLGVDSELTRLGPTTAEAWLTPFQGETGKLVIKLVSRGSANAVVVLDQVEVTTLDDPDFDGLTTAQELALGTDPLAWDSDGDGLSDAYEASISLTQPLVADTDGDGQTDALEILAGTNPTDSRSIFAVTEVSKYGGGFLLRWSAVAGKTYRVLRSSTPGFASFDVIASSIAGVAPTTTYTDTTISTVTTPAAFYRIEAE